MYPIAAIDPGVEGGIVYAHAVDNIIAISMPDTPDEIWQVFQDLKQHGLKRVVMEKVTGYIPGRPQPASRAGTFMKNVGHLEMASRAVGITPELVTPQAWQIKLGMFKNTGESYDKWKSRLWELAKQFFPLQRVTKKCADAFLLLAYAQQISIIS